MAEHDVYGDERLQDYVDGRLNDRDRAEVAAYLLAHPEVAAQVRTMREQNEALRVVGQEILDEPIPARLLEVLHPPNAVEPEKSGRRRSMAFLEAAAAVLLFCAGGAIGWFANDRLTRLGVDHLIAADAARVYAFYGAQRDYPLDFPPDRTAEFASWINRSFERNIQPPDLQSLAYEYRGGRLLPTADAHTGFFQFEGPEQARLAVFFWRAERPPSQVAELSLKDNVSARYWFGDGISFAVMSDEGNQDLEAVADAVFSFYDNALTSQASSAAP